MQFKISLIDDINAYVTRSIPQLLVVSARGRVPSTGWTRSLLVPSWYASTPDDGFWEFDFCASAPTGTAYESGVLTPISADITLPVPKWCRAVRVRASSNAIEYLLFVTEAQRNEAAALGDSFIPVPWQAIGSQDDVASGKYCCEGMAFDFALNPASVERAQARIGLAVPEAPTGLDRPLTTLVGTQVRVFREGDPITLDYVPERFNIEQSFVGNITRRVFFG